MGLTDNNNFHFLVNARFWKVICIFLVVVSDSLVNDVDMYEITTGFGGTSYRRTNQGVALQNELIRSFLNST